MKEEYFMGVDFAAKLKWWQRILVWFGFKNKWTDKSCSVIYKRQIDGTYEIVRCDYF